MNKEQFFYKKITGRYAFATIAKQVIIKDEKWSN